MRATFRLIYERLEMFPAIGAPRPGLGAGIRIAMLSPYIVIYRLESNTAETLTIARVLDGRRNITRRMVPE
jgi:toxin ParE1/3/4